VEEWFFFNRIHIEGNGSTEDEGDELPFTILPHPADTSFGGGEEAPMIAEMTLYYPLL
jgi:hypothetical protein